MAETKTVAKPTASRAGTIGKILARNDVSVLIATAVLFLIFAFGTESFFTPYNLYNVSRSASLYVFVALGQAIVIVIGDMNIALGAIGALTVVTAGYSMEVLGLNPIAAAALTLGVGALCGAFNGFIIVKSKLNSFVVTLASSFIFQGLVNGISKGFSYSKLPPEITMIGRDDMFGVPNLFWVAIITLLVVGYVFKFTVIGRRILATGGNREAAKLSGIRTDNITLLAHTMSGVFAAMAGLLWISRMASAQPSTGSDWLIISFAVAIIGGTALSGGEISALGLFASAILLTLIKNGLIMLNVNVYFEQTFLGIIILLAVSVETLRNGIGSLAKRVRRT